MCNGEKMRIIDDENKKNNNYFVIKAKEDITGRTFGRRLRLFFR